MATREQTESIIISCGRTLVIHVFGNDRETALWFGRGLGHVIAEGKHSEKDIRDLVGATWNSYLIACSLRPAIDAKPYFEEVRRAIHSD